MAYVVPTAMEQYILNSQNNADFHELNRGHFGAYQLGIDMVNSGMAPVSLQFVRDKMKTLSNVPKMAVMNKDGVTINTARDTVPLTATFGTSSFVDLTRSTVEAVIKVVPNIHGDNAAELEAYTMKKVKQAVQAMKKQIESVVLLAVDGAKSEVSASAYPFAFDATADAYLVDVAAGVTDTDEKSKTFLKWIEALDSYYMADELTEQPIAVLGSPNTFAAYNYSNRFKTNNAEDLNQILTGLQPYGSSEIAQGGGTPTNIGTAYSFAPNTYGLYTVMNSDAIEAREATNGTVRVINLPGIGEVEMFMGTEFQDLSATFGAEYSRVYTETLSFSLDFVTVFEHQSAPTTVAKAIKKALWRDNA